MRKIGIVVQRYGEDIVGGAESYCRQIAERLAASFEVEVLTSKSSDYMTWKIDIESDSEQLNGVLIRRFGSSQQRCLTDELYQKAFEKGASSSVGMDWVVAQGPYCPGPVDYVEQHGEEYDAFILMTYLYYPTVAASKVVGHKSVLIPTAHDELPIHQAVYSELFANAAAWYYLTPEEKSFVEGMFDASDKVVGTGNGGVGVDVPRDVDERVFRKKYGLGDSPYIIYAGRIEEGKGCGALFRYFAGWKLRHPGDDLKLVLVGAAKMPVLDHPDVLYLGFVDEVDKFSGIKGALSLVQPSRFESLSIVLLEALRSGTPVLVNGTCKVLKGHCLRSNAGLYYANYLEFEKELEYMMTHPDVHGRMSELGVRYVEEHYSWDAIMGELCSLIDRVAAR